MIYAPHTLYKKQVGQIKNDSFGKPLSPTEKWVEIGRCRCDDDSTQELRSDNGQLYKSRYHVVLEKGYGVTEGDEIKCVNADGSTRAQGIVGMVKSTNYLSYSELWT